MLMHRLCFLLVLNLVPLLAAADLDDASARLFQAQVARAEKGEANDQYYLGEMYEQGLGTKADMDKALEWYRKSASQGNALATKKLGDLARAKAEAEKEAIAREKVRAAQVDADKTAKENDDAARRRHAKEAYEKARAQQQKAGGLWQ